MEYYQSIHPKQEDSVYVLYKYRQEVQSLLGIFDLLETALHALDVVTKFKALDMEIDDQFIVSRHLKNSLRPGMTPLVSWTCTALPKNGCSVGKLELNPCLRTHDLSGI